MTFNTTFGGWDTFGEAVAAAGMAFEPKLQPMYLSDGTMVEGSRAVVREGPDGVRASLGVVGDRYVPLSYTEVAEVLDREVQGVALSDLVQPNGVLAFRSGAQVVLTGEIRGGTATIRSPRTGVDAIAANINISSSLDGSSAYHVLPSGHRVVCKNTLALAVRQDVWKMKAKHTAGGRGRFVSFVAGVRETLNKLKNQAELWQRMANTKATESQVVDYFRAVFSPGGSATEAALHGTESRGPLVVSVDDILRETEVLQGKRGKLIETLLEAYETAPGAEPGTVWGAYQAASYHLTHTAGRSDETRARSLFFGTGAQQIALAETLATRMVSA